MFEYGLTLKAGELFFASNVQSDGNRESAAGLYFRDTRFLSECDLTLNGKSLELLSVKSATLERAMVYLTNPAVSDAHGERVPGHQLSIVATLELTDQLTISLEIQ
ncbi:MAG: glycogen debranching N-terminal domain-containing protein, partial [Thermomicrobiales bacterium]